MTEDTERSKAAYRLEVVAAYMGGDMAVTVFANLFNAGDIYGYLSKETGPIEAEDLDRWADACMEAVK